MRFNLKKDFSTIFFIIAYSLITLIFSIGLSSISKETEKYKINNPKYNKQIVFPEESNISLSELRNLLKNDNISVILRKYRTDNIIIETYLNSKGIFYVEDMKEGVHFSTNDFDSKKNIAMFSSTFVGDRFVKVSIDNEIKEVNLIEVGTSYAKEPKVTIPIDLFERHLLDENLNNNTLDIIFSGNEKEINKAISKLNKEFFNNEKEVISKDYFLYDISSEWKSLGKSAMLILLITLITTFGISYFVISDKEKEIIVKKVFGASDLAICKEFFSEFFSIASLSFVIAILTQFILSILNKGYLFSLNIEMNFYNIVFSILVVLITSILSLMPFLYHLRKIQPVEITRNIV